MPSPKPLSDSAEEYLEAIERLQHSPEGVSTTRLSKHLNVKPASVTGMLRRLSDLRLITYRRYGRISLTPKGQLRAHELIRRHRLAERLLTDLLGFPLEQAHDEACRIEHAVSPELEHRIAQTLGRPEACPHGHPIDVSVDDHTISLAEAPPGRTFTIVRLDDESSDMVRYLSERKLLPGRRVKVKLRESIGEVLVVDVGGQAHALGAAPAAAIRVRPVRGTG